METDSFIQALRKFIYRRGPVREIRFDRGTNFIGAENELKRAIEEIDGEKERRSLYCTRRENSREKTCIARRNGEQHLVQEFWQRWSKEYLQQLQSRYKWTQPKRNVTTGDVVLLREVQYPRNKWPLAKVVRAYPDHQGQVRSVT
ncbi:Nuclear factor related to kappa-B-binding, partial [Paramuricea clavata]